MKSIIAVRLPLWLLAATLLLAAGLLLLAKPASAQVSTTPNFGVDPIVNEPPASGHEIIAFPKRDFVSASGYPKGTYRVEVLRGTPGNETVVSVSDEVNAQDDPSTSGFDGIIEVNHPGGGCWETVTPDIKPGDKVRVLRLKDEFGADNPLADQTTVADVTTNTPKSEDTSLPATEIIKQSPLLSDSNSKWTIRIHGTAKDANDAPLPITQLEHRFISKKDKFAINGRRDLRATGGEAPRRGGGTINYDAVGSTSWTAEYKDLNLADKNRVLNSQSRGMWLGADPAAGNELTIYEAGEVAGPSAPCTAPLEGAPTTPVDPVAPDAAPATTTLNDPPADGHEIIAFPERDFISASGYATGEYTVNVLRKKPDGSLVTVGSTKATAEDDVGTAAVDGIIEVNHPGGACWVGQTPDIKPGDIVRITDSAGKADQTTVANVTANPVVDLGGGTIQITGTALDADGNALPLDQIEQRLISSSKNPFVASGNKRSLRAPGNGTLTIDASGNWTATYTGLSATDVETAKAAQVRILWLGGDPLAGTELTIFEQGEVGGPAAPCTAPAGDLETPTTA